MAIMAMAIIERPSHFSSRTERALHARKDTHSICTHSIHFIRHTQPTWQQHARTVTKYNTAYRIITHLKSEVWSRVKQAHTSWKAKVSTATPKRVLKEENDMYPSCITNKSSLIYEDVSRSGGGSECAHVLSTVLLKVIHACHH